MNNSKWWVVLTLCAGSCGLSLMLAQNRSDPHGPMKACGTKATIGLCRCPEIVRKIQQYEISKCGKPPLVTLEQWRECMGAAWEKTSHCEIMTNGHKNQEWDKFLRDKNGVLTLCGTQCNHSSCFCGDPSCADLQRAARMRGQHPWERLMSRLIQLHPISSTSASASALLACCQRSDKK